VIVGDANDNSPQFGSSSYDAEVSESSPIGTTVLRLSADDPDDGLNGVVVYRLARRPGLRSSSHLLSSILLSISYSYSYIFYLASRNH